MSTSATVPMLSPDGQIGDVPQENAGKAVQSGFKMGQDMLSPDGQAGVIPFDQVHQALAKGFQLKGAAPAAPKEDVEPEKMTGWQKMRGNLADFFRLDMSKQEDHERAVAPIRSAGKVVNGMLDSTVDAAKTASAPNILFQLYKHFKGEPSDLDKIPAAGVMTFLAALGDPESEAGTPVARLADPIADTGARVAKGLAKARKIWKASDSAVDEISEPEALEAPAKAKPAPAARGKTGEEDRPDVNDVPQDEWDAAHEGESKPDNSPKPTPSAGQKAAAEKAFLDHLGKSKEDIAAAKAKQAVAYQKHLTKAAQKGVDFGPKGGVTPELHESARAAGRQAYLKHLGIDEMKLEEAKSAGRQGAMSHYKQAMADLTGRKSQP
jgi:hypothetical protein